MKNPFITSSPYTFKVFRAPGSIPFWETLENELRFNYFWCKHFGAPQVEDRHSIFSSEFWEEPLKLEEHSRGRCRSLEIPRFLSFSFISIFSLKILSLTSVLSYKRNGPENRFLPSFVVVSSKGLSKGTTVIALGL